MVVAGILESILGGTGVIAAAVIAGSVAVRNARKTPHETLKSLLEILSDEHVWREDRPILAAAVHREIQRIELLNEARLQGFWAYQRARYLSLVSPFTWYAFITAFLLPTLTIPTAWLWPISPAFPDQPPPTQEVYHGGVYYLAIASYKWRWDPQQLTGAWHSFVVWPKWMVLATIPAVIVIFWLWAVPDE